MPELELRELDRFLVHEEAPSQRSIHALVIGVGDYRHLIGGSGVRTQSHDGMGQLKSPPTSARKIADWLIAECNHPDYPGRTVSLLLSEPEEPARYRNPKTHASHQVEKSNYQNIADALVDWKARGDVHEDDMLAFYFCGHGVSEGLSMVLLPSDFGSNPNNAYDTSLDFLALYDAMAQAKAKFQCFFVDACRASSDTLGRNNGRNPIQIGPRTYPEPRIAPIYYATLKGDDAHGRENAASIYCEALLGALRDFAATDREGDGDWRVSTRTLSDALDHLMKRQQETGKALVQVPDSTEIHNPFYLCHLDHHPRASLYVTSMPRERLREAKLVCRSGSAEVGRRDRLPEDEWVIDVPVGQVEVEAYLLSEPGPRPPHRTYANPPFRRTLLKLQ
jgi:hypothetical protein